MENLLQETQRDKNLKLIVKKQQVIITKQKTTIIQLKSIIKNLSYNTSDKNAEKKVLKDDFNSHEPVKTQTSILLVEDHPIAAKIAKNILSALNCQIDTAVNGKTALELTENRHYDLIFMDIGLPDMNGLEVTRCIRANESTKGKYVPIIALTAHGDNDSQQLCLDAGMNAIITKPLFKSKAIDILTTFIPVHKKWLESRT